MRSELARSDENHKHRVLESLEPCDIPSSSLFNPASNPSSIESSAVECPRCALLDLITTSSHHPQQRPALFTEQQSFALCIRLSLDSCYTTVPRPPPRHSHNNHGLQLFTTLRKWWRNTFTLPHAPPQLLRRTFTRADSKIALSLTLKTVALSLAQD